MLKIDLAMWAKNGGRSLPVVLNRIEEVIPPEHVSSRIFVDDHSTDGSREIAKEFNWSVYPNPTGFLSGGTNEALRHVKEPFFVSVEQDVILARNWWERIPRYMEDGDVAVAQGIRLSTHPLMHEFDRPNPKLLAEQNRKRIPDYYWSLDNNIFRTRIVRELGGFSKKEPLAVDYFFLKELEQKTHYKWIVDSAVISSHLRTSLSEHFKHDTRFMILTSKEVQAGDSSLLRMLSLTATSPIRGLQLALRRRNPQFFPVYPYIRLMYLRSYLLARSLAMRS